MSRKNDFPSHMEKFTRLVNFYIYLHARKKINDYSFKQNVSYLDKLDERQMDIAYHNTRNVSYMDKEKLDWDYIDEHNLWWYDGWEYDV